MTNGANHSTTNRDSNGTINGTGNLDGYAAIETTHNPHIHNSSPYAPIGDFLSNIGRFKIIGKLRFASTTTYTDILYRKHAA